MVRNKPTGCNHGCDDMNKTDIAWAEHTWNCVTGCRHTCAFGCYARPIAKRLSPKPTGCSGALSTDDEHGALHEVFAKQPSDRSYPFGFEPTMNWHRLTEPMKRKKPTRIFVSSMGDLFGAWVPDDWIDAVRGQAVFAPQHTFIYLTKNPMRYRAVGQFRHNEWIGSTVTEAGQVGWNLFALGKVDAGMRFLSVEPMLDAVRLPADAGDVLDWCIIGPLSLGGGEYKRPPAEWVEDLIADCRREGVAVFVKPHTGVHEDIVEVPKAVGDLV
jgi:protein gp37